jgi:hypothetical protein
VGSCDPPPIRFIPERGGGIRTISMPLVVRNLDHYYLSRTADGIRAGDGDRVAPSKIDCGATLMTSPLVSQCHGQPPPLPVPLMI